MTEEIQAEKATGAFQSRVAALTEKYEKEDAAAPETEPEVEETQAPTADKPETSEPAVAAAPSDDARLHEFEKVSKAQAAIRRAEKEMLSEKAAFEQERSRFAAERPLLERLTKAKTDPVAFLDLIDEYVPPEKAAEYFMRAGTPRDRDRARIEARLDQERAERIRLENEIKGNYARQQHDAIVQHVHREFLSVRDKNAAQFPSVARMPADFLINAANAKADELQSRGVEWGYLDVLKELEEETKTFLKHFQDPVESASTEDEQPTRGRQATAPLRGSSAESSGSGSKKKETRDERLRRLRRQYGE